MTREVMTFLAAWLFMKLTWILPNTVEDGVSLLSIRKSKFLANINMLLKFTGPNSKFTFNDIVVCYKAIHKYARVVLTDKMRWKSLRDPCKCS